jgi:phosphoadenosine phosphosulfate reductase
VLGVILRADARALPLFRDFPDEGAKNAAVRLGFLIQRSVTLLWANVPKDGRPYIGAFSGGKDSVVIKELAKMAGVPVEWQYNNTTIDPPELIYFMRKHHPDVTWNQPHYGSLLVYAERVAGYPTRIGRWCCAKYKDNCPGKKGRSTILGVRIAESKSRTQRWTKCVMEDDRRLDVIRVLPIRLWSEEDVWSFIRERGIPYCSLYDEGFTRLGCVGCPMTHTKQRQKEFDRWPGFERRWKLMFRRLWERKAGTQNRKGEEWWGSRHCDSWEELWDWWNGGQDNITKWRTKHGLRIKVAPKIKPGTTPAIAGLM